jgi:hypothetical protein
MPKSKAKDFGLLRPKIVTKAKAFVLLSRAKQLCKSFCLVEQSETTLQKLLSC